MAWQTLHFNVVGDEQFAKGFSAMAAEVADMRVPFTEIGQILLRGIAEQFRTEGGYGGSKWKPLSPAYEQWKRGAVGDEPILVLHGTMRSAMLAQNSLHTWPQRLLYEPDAPIYALRHQTGDPGEHPMPQRKMIEIPFSERRSFDRVFAAWLADIRRSGWGTAGL
jgi:Phage virion morphogenesis family